jgi:predicted MFS family arabinose efflux permease
MQTDGRIITRPFVMGFLLTFFMYFAVGAAIPLLPRLVTNGLGGNRGDIGLLAAAFSLAAVLCRPLLSLVSRRGARALAIAGGLLAVVGYGLMWRVSSLPVLTVSRILAAIGEALVWTAFSTLSTVLAPAHRQAEAVSLASVALFLGLGLGPLATEGLSRSGHFATAAIVPTVSSALCVVVGLFIRREWVPPLADTSGRLRAKEIFHPAALLPGLALGLIVLGWSAWNNYVALRADEIGMSNAAILFTVYSGLSLGIRLVGAKLPDRLGHRRCASGAAVLVTVSLIVLGWATTATGLMVGAAVMALGVAFMFPALSALALGLMQDPADRAPLMSSFGMFFEVGAGVGGFVIAPVARRSGLSAAFTVAAAGPVLGFILLQVYRHRFPAEGPRSADTAGERSRSLELIAETFGEGC